MRRFWEITTWLARGVLAITCGVLLLTLAWGATSAPEEVLAADETTVMLVGYDDEGILHRYCSGAFVDNVVITAGHCVLDGAGGVNLHPLIRTFDGLVWSGEVLGVSQAWPTTDYAVIDMPFIAGLYPSLERGDGLNVGEALWAFSGPWGLGTLLLDGIYSGRISDDPSIDPAIRYMHYATMNGSGGSSGSVILNNDGQAEAILVGAFGEDERSLRLVGSLLVDLPPRH